MTGILLSERHGSVLWLTLNRQAVHNALNLSLTEALVDAFAAASADDDLRAVVLTGAGERTFCAGADLKDIDGGMFASSAGANPIANVIRAIGSCSKPVICRVNGSAFGGGLGLVSACDLAYAADHANFGTPEVRVGVFPLMIATTLMRQVPQRRLREMAYLGEPLNAAEAERYGLINRAVPAGELDGVIDTVIAKLMRGSPSAMRMGKAAFGEMQDMPQDERLAYAERMIGLVADTPDAREGRAAFGEKRKPRWVPE
ncbi:enoyl-CoA hydratase/isomerase family protein [Rhizobium sp. KVB221]|uniref:Enoyl-CoA hydratase/isomerase family protein n=1 Tax=Rhizobium setariae TaxID=2801340 RepID=A0A937CN12_9HYPH|nr:enoyl-CoA hydratase-related protein [Rhizobium setariae]MBL0373296.1 enoyl-CoA hydratase/isomerase family protein [Rhizobium setariae]